MPASDFSRLSMVSQLEEYLAELEMAVKLGAALEPRMIVLVMTSVVAKVIEEDPICHASVV
eukprot:8200466-Prorocentrum_lima.AAC.1